MKKKPLRGRLDPSPPPPPPPPVSEGLKKPFVFGHGFILVLANIFCKNSELQSEIPDWRLSVSLQAWYHCFCFSEYMPSVQRKLSLFVTDHTNTWAALQRLRSLFVKCLPTDCHCECLHYPSLDTNHEEVMGELYAWLHVQTFQKCSYHRRGLRGLREIH